MVKDDILIKIVDLEKRRDLLSRTGKLGLLKKLYKTGIPHLINRNRPEYWDSLLNFSAESGEMDKDKIDIVSRIVEHKGGKILDVGFGTGNLEKKLVNVKNIDWYGLEMSPLAVKHALKNYRGRFYKGSVLKIPFPDKFFDVCVCLEVLEHISPDKIIMVLSEVKRVLKRRGLFIVSVPLNEDLILMEKRRQNISAHVRQYTKNIIKGELMVAGFKILLARYLFSFKNYYSLKKILQKFVFKNRWKPNNFLLVAEPK